MTGENKKKSRKSFYRKLYAFFSISLSSFQKISSLCIFLVICSYTRWSKQIENDSILHKLKHPINTYFTWNWRMNKLFSIVRKLLLIQFLIDTTKSEWNKWSLTILFCHLCTSSLWNSWNAILIDGMWKRCFHEWICIIYLETVGSFIRSLDFRS